MDLYYNANFGYILCAQARLEDSVARVVLYPVTRLEPSASDLELGSELWKSLERSRKARPVPRSELGKNKFWVDAGYRSFYSFSKEFSCVSITVVGTKIEVLPLVRDPQDGGYVCPSYDPKITLQKDSPTEDLGRAVRAVLSGQALPEENALRTFETLQGDRVTYRRPSDLFLDCGDGHTDAYQVYQAEAYPDSRLAFLIGDRYTNEISQCSGADIHQRWQSEYGTLLDFHVFREHGPDPWMEVRGRTAEKELAVYVFPDGAETLEVMLELDLLNTPEDVQEQIRQDFDAMVRSIRITPAGEQKFSPPRIPYKEPAPEHGKNIFLWVQFILTCIAAAVIFVPIYDAWKYMSFAGFGAVIALFFLGPGLVGLIAEAVLFFLALRRTAGSDPIPALAAYVIQIVCGLPSTCLLLVAPEYFWILGVHTALMFLGFVGLIRELVLASWRRKQ